MGLPKEKIEDKGLRAKSNRSSTLKCCLKEIQQKISEGVARS
jgi:hypothetical protein